MHIRRCGRVWGRGDWCLRITDYDPAYQGMQEGLIDDENLEGYAKINLL